MRTSQVSHSNPWLTGDATKDSEIAVFRRIANHKRGTLPFPHDLSISDELADLLAGLPVLLVRSWAEVDAPRLRAEFARASRTTYDLRKLTTAFWRGELDRARATDHGLVEVG